MSFSFTFHHDALAPGLRCGRRIRPAMTLVEVMVAFSAFVIAVLAALNLMMFNLRTLDQVRANTQITQILMHEMESMRMRTWEDRAVSSAPGGVLYGIQSLGMGASANGAGSDLTTNTTDNENGSGQVK